MVASQLHESSASKGRRARRRNAPTAREPSLVVQGAHEHRVTHALEQPPVLAEGAARLTTSHHRSNRRPSGCFMRRPVMPVAVSRCSQYGRLPPGPRSSESSDEIDLCRRPGRFRSVGVETLGAPHRQFCAPESYTCDHARRADGGFSRSGDRLSLRCCCVQTPGSSPRWIIPANMST